MSGVGATVLIQIVNTSFLRRTKFVLSSIENKYSNKHNPTKEHFKINIHAEIIKGKVKHFTILCYFDFQKYIAFKKDKLKIFIKMYKIGVRPNSSFLFVFLKILAS